MIALEFTARTLLHREGSSALNPEDALFGGFALVGWLVACGLAVLAWCAGKEGECAQWKATQQMKCHAAREPTTTEDARATAPLREAARARRRSLIATCATAATKLTGDHPPAPHCHHRGRSLELERHY
jgi:hypothetical protein